MDGKNVKDSRADRLIPWYFVLFFVVIAVVDGIFVTVAVRTQTGIVRENAYEEGLAYNRVLEAARAQDDLGWRSDIVLEGNTLRVLLEDKGGRTISGASMTARVRRPVQAGHDFEMPLSELEDGSYQSQIVFPLKGQWEIRVFAQWQNRQYQSSRVVVVR